MAVRNFKDLLVWQKGIELVEVTYKLVKYLPKDEIYALSGQMRRAAVSIPSNIAEGQQRKSEKEFANFLSIARGSVVELETQYIICEKLEYLSKEQIELPINTCQELYKMLNTFISKLNED